MRSATINRARASVPMIHHMLEDFILFRIFHVVLIKTDYINAISFERLRIYKICERNSFIVSLAALNTYKI